MDLSAEERDLGMDRAITRRDFLNTVVLGAGATLLNDPAPAEAKPSEPIPSPSVAPTGDPWTGYGGVGDYAHSNGNTWDVVNAGHGIRDQQYTSSLAPAASTGECYDLVIVGGGFAGVIAAHTFLKETDRRRSVLLIDNHPLIGGEAKRNEFMVQGQRLLGVQGSMLTVVMTGGWPGELWREIGLPMDFEFAKLSPERQPMAFPLDDSVTMGMSGSKRSGNFGHFFSSPHPHWVTNPWATQLAGTPWSPEARRDLLRWRNEPAPSFEGDPAHFEPWLDTMTYEEYLIKVRGLRPEVARYADLTLTGLGIGSDVLSACAVHRMQHLHLDQGSTGGKPVFREPFSFPGGNDGIMRALVKRLNPDVIEGSNSFADVHNGRIQFDAMDKSGAACRMRVAATVVRVAHDPENTKRPVTITYVRGGRLFTVQARKVIWAGASWSAKHVIQNVPEEYQLAMEGFPRSPALVVNVALNNWRALYKLGYTSCAWQGEFGFWGTLRAPMYVGNYRPPLDPDQPAIFAMKVMFPEVGLSLKDQGRVGRVKLYATSYREFETRIRRQLTTLFGGAGFDAGRDIAGIVLNRWGHAYVNCGPGFFFGLGGKATPNDVLRQPLGNIGFANSELAGIQSWWGAGEEGIRAARQVLAML